MDSKSEKPTAFFYQSHLFRDIIGENPIVLVDVGARGGVARKWQPLKRSIKVIGFEPDANECQRLNKATRKNDVFFPVALFNKKGRINLNLTRKLSCSSIFEPNYALVERFLDSENYDVTSSIEIPCDTMDGIVETSQITDIDFIKLDAQGAELQILEEARNTLSQFCVFGIEIELGFSPLYKDQPLFADVDGLLKEKGFSLFDIAVPLGRKVRKTTENQSKALKGQVLWTHAVYFRDFLSEKNKPLEDLSLEKAAKTIAIAELHGFNDFALELLDFHLNEGIIPDSIYGEIRKMLTIKEKTSPKIEETTSPETKLYRNIRRDVGEFISVRFPFIYKWLVSIIRPRRG